MEKVLGLGGVFFRADDPNALAIWYRDHLGIDLVPKDIETPAWQQTAGTCVFAPFPKDTTYFNANKSVMLNFRVADIDAMVTQLEGAGVAVARQNSMEGIGHFAHLEDPEGNPIELWEPVSAP
ncbi:MAG: VOC family protein [Pseudomonadota bacterium]